MKKNVGLWPCYCGRIGDNMYSEITVVDEETTVVWATKGSLGCTKADHILSSGY